MPRITFCHSCGIDMICSPLLRTEMISAPMMVPTIDPLPPASDVPPMTTAAIAWSS